MSQPHGIDLRGRPIGRKFPLIDRIRGPYTVYGEVEYIDESGKAFYIVECADQASYDHALNVGAEWATAERRRPLDVRGTRFSPPRPAGFTREAVTA